MDLEVYCDESRQELFRSPTPGKSYVLIGGIWIKGEDRRAHKEAIKELRARHRASGEFKWNRVSPSRIEFYAELVQIFFSREVRFRTLVLRADELDAIRLQLNICSTTFSTPLLMSMTKTSSFIILLI